MKTRTYVKLDELKEKMPERYQDIAHFVQHTFEAIDEMVQEHERLNHTYTHMGHRIDKEQEKVYSETIVDLKFKILETLEKTAEDILHRGDKHWDKHYKDGVD